MVKYRIHGIFITLHARGCEYEIAVTSCFRRSPLYSLSLSLFSVLSLGAYVVLACILKSVLCDQPGNTPMHPLHPPLLLLFPTSSALAQNCFLHRPIHPAPPPDPALHTRG